MKHLKLILFGLFILLTVFWVLGHAYVFVKVTSLLAAICVLALACIVLEILT